MIFTINNKTIDVEGNINVVLKVFLGDKASTFYVLDSERVLLGIITFGDILRKFPGVKSLREFMNQNYIKIELDFLKKAGYPHVRDDARKIFSEKPNITEIPIVDHDGKLLFSVQKEKPIQFTYNLKLIEEILKLRNDDKYLVKSLKLANIDTIDVIRDGDEMLMFVAGILNRHFYVSVYENYEEYLASNKKKGLVLLSPMNICPERELKIIRNGHFFYYLQWLLLHCSNLVYMKDKIDILNSITDELFVFHLPDLFQLKKTSVRESDILCNPGTHDYDAIIMGLGVQDKGDYIKQVTHLPTVVERKGEWCWGDYNNKYVNIVDGRRVTTDYNDKYNNKIFVLGNSVAYGVLGEDKHTIPSIMQRILNKSENPYEVINCGLIQIFTLYNVLEQVKKGDKIIIVLGGYGNSLIINALGNSPQIRYCPLAHLFERPHDMGEVFINGSHLNHIGKERVAREILDIMCRNDKVSLVNSSPADHFKYKSDEIDFIDKGIDSFIDNIVKMKVKAENIGALVMNCNPFTYGHRHLIEYAAACCGHLFIFVVEEDKSFFKFKDRFDMVKNGTADLRNLTVLPSGRFIISAITFADYFNKDALNGATVDPSADVEIFAKYIAPVLGITKRFAGEEPNDHVTAIYNKTMREILPKHGIEFVEINRKEFGGRPISASTVRELIKKGDFRDIEQIVPQSSLSIIHSYISNNIN